MSCAAANTSALARLLLATALIGWPSVCMAGIIRVAAISLPPISPQRVTRTAFA